MEETKTEEKRGWLTGWKRILLFSLFFSILVVSLFYYVLPRVFIRLRIDAIPQGAYVVPWMRPNPSIKELNLYPQLPYSPPTFDIDSVMAGALKLNMTFRIDIPGGTRVVPSTVYLGHDADLLYVAGKFIGMYTNPVSDYVKGDIMPNIFGILFDVKNDGVLTNPESGSRLAAYVYQERVGFLIYVDRLWCHVPQYGRASWVPSDNYYDMILGKTQPSFAVEDMAAQYDNSTGTVMMILSRLLNCPGNIEANALQMRPGERWVMGFLLELGYKTDIGSFGDYVDGWPQKIYPYLSNNCSWWPKLDIDLSNPPTQYPGEPNSPVSNKMALDIPNHQNLFHLETTPAYTMTVCNGAKYRRNEN